VCPLRCVSTVEKKCFKVRSKSSQSNSVASWGWQPIPQSRNSGGKWVLAEVWSFCRWIGSAIFTQLLSAAKRGGCFQRHLFVCPHDNFWTFKRRKEDETSWLGALYKNLARVRMSMSKVKVTRDKNALSVADAHRVRTNGMRSLQTACNSSGRAHFVAARGCFRGLACCVCLVNHL